MNSSLPNLLLRTGYRHGNKGFAILELAVVLLIFSLVLIPALTYFSRHRRGISLEAQVKKIVGLVDLAQAYAVTERRDFHVIFEDTGEFYLLRADAELIGKKHRFPDSIGIKEKSAGFDPLVMRSDGTAGMGGYIVISDLYSGEEKRIVMHNLTGRCFVE